MAGATVIRSVISPRVQIHPGALIERSAILEGAIVGRGTVVRHGIIDQEVTIPDGAEIGVDPDRDHERFTVTPQGVVVVTKADVFRRAWAWPGGG